MAHRVEARMLVLMRKLHIIPRTAAALTARLIQEDTQSTECARLRYVELEQLAMGYGAADVVVVRPVVGYPCGLVVSR